MTETKPMHAAAVMTLNRAARRAVKKAQGRAPARRVRQAADPLAAFRKIKTARALASVDQLSADQLRDLAIGYHGALAEVVQGRGTWDDANTLALAANVALVLADYGLGRNELETVKRGQLAVVQLAQRGTLGGHYALTGTELQDLQALLELHEAQLEHEACTEGVMVAALAEIKRRMADGDVMGGV